MRKPQPLKASETQDHVHGLRCSECQCYVYVIYGDDEMALDGVAIVPACRTLEEADELAREGPCFCEDPSLRSDEEIFTWGRQISPNSTRGTRQ